MTRHTSHRARTDFYIKLASLVPFLALIATGLILQVEYHLHRLPDAAAVLGLDRRGWLSLHIVAAFFSVASMAHHCARHRRFIVTGTKKKVYLKKMSPPVLSYYLFVVFVPTALTALVSWLFLEGHARFMLVEIHDKLALLLAVVFLGHLATRAGSMVKTYRSLASERRRYAARP